MFGRLGFGELLLLLAIILVLFGAKRIPQIGASIGKGIREFKRGLNDANRQVNETRRAPGPDAPRIDGTTASFETRKPFTPPAEEARREPKRLL